MSQQQQQQQPLPNQPPAGYDLHGWQYPHPQQQQQQQQGGQPAPGDTDSNQQPQQGQGMYSGAYSQVPHGMEGYQTQQYQYPPADMNQQQQYQQYPYPPAPPQHHMDHAQAPHHHAAYYHPQVSQQQQGAGGDHDGGVQQNEQELALQPKAVHPTSGAAHGPPPYNVAAVAIAGSAAGVRAEVVLRRRTVPPSEAWESKYVQLKEFYEEFGHSSVPQSYKTNRALGKWVGKQREHWRIMRESGSSPLTDERIARLKLVDFKFVIGKGQHAKIHGIFITEKQIDAWEAKFKELEEYKERHGDVDVPQKYPPNRSLASWVMKQRKKFKGGSGDELTTETKILKDRQQRLRDLGFNFDASATTSGGRNNGYTREHRGHAVAWDEKFERLKAYKERHGDCDVPHTYKEDAPLAVWVAKQREKWRARDNTNPSRALSDERLAKLQGVGFNFDTFEASWEKRLQELKDYKEKYGTAKVRDGHNRSLWHWSKRQRDTFKAFLEGKKGAMNHERVRRLEELGFEWQYEEIVSREKKRERRKEATRGGKVTEGSDAKERNAVDEITGATHSGGSSKTSAPPGEPEVVELPGVTDGASSSKKDSSKEKNPNDEVIASAEAEVAIIAARITAERGKTTSRPERWLDMYRQLIDFKRDHSHCRVQIREKGYNKLGPWVKLQREEYKNWTAGRPTPFTQWKVGLLEMIGFDWRCGLAAPTSWEDRYAQLQQYKKEFGDCNVPQAWPRNVNLGKWVSKQRDHFRYFKEGKKSRLDSERIEKLDNLGFEWFRGKGKGLRTWNKYFSDLIKFKEKYGHANVPVGYKEDPALASWANQQRVNYRYSQSMKTRPSILQQNQRLESIGFNFHGGVASQKSKRRSDFGVPNPSKGPKRRKGALSEDRKPKTKEEATGISKKTKKSTGNVVRPEGEDQGGEDNFVMV